MKFISVTSVVLVVAGSANAASLAENDATFICAVVDLASCGPGEGCTRETSESINAPQLLTVDRKGHAITAQRPDGAVLSSNIDRVTQEQDLLVFDGVQNGLSWTMTIAGASGHMTLSAIGDSEAYTVFGSCELK
ncbi:MAG: hypothetical protein QOF70_7611 [Acetobacteraceae bacterium]|jgi:hypothetical protein|nr:hypothetical protein [Acetobacteraceae bacterium]